ncbi:S8 family serine peptidase [Bythopirellula goksoeyrii]|uniref:Subtilisin E n=1 Tax=Bythopirellula goksoeyrii TaxID=1400387 RepID=A0A5B9QGD8_9BACT|nr:S8 family serine peptidase [Bythopirellula goksoeyrii]QEG36642.1 Subtilisin E precursor [Bythopirellula goksoeyrii]
MHKPPKKLFDWKGRIEPLEERRVMSADPLSGFLGEGIIHHAFDESIVHHGFVEESSSIEHHLASEPDYWFDPSESFTFEEQIGEIEQALSSAHNATGLNQVLADYGFTGKGQTVAIIDSGIAYNHFALGGGLGANYRVVGGYDFTENDADPYDDGPEGSHGTHVAGIVGGDAGADHGVASGVDLVGLRVFDDSGAGYMSWVERALQWVHDNRTSFENPITAVNLSLGIPGYNSSSSLITNLDDEFSQLKADGIFISVSAGNGWASYNTPGLGNPASSPNVVPVMSVKDNGQLAGYSQRDVRAIAAPGSSIRSTIPDYKGNNNGIDDDYAYYSGTSMASPYIAGASVLIREAMQFVGYTDITQDTIYDHMRDTADEFLDAATNLTFKRINIEAAISALMPSDDYGSTLATAFNLGNLTSTVSQSGVIGTLNDIDYFKFTASSDGTVTVEADNMTHELAAAWTVSGSTGTVSGNQNESFSFDVVAGQTYTVGFSSSGGLGYFTLDATLEASNTFTFTDWGTVSYAQLNGLSVEGESWYRVQASQAGYMTVEGAFDAQGGQVNLMLYDVNMQMVTSGNAAGGISRVDAYATAGEEFYVCVQGMNDAVDYRLSNLVTVNGTTVNVTGTTGDDTFAFTAGDTHQVTVNGVTHNFAAIAVTNIILDGGAGNDTIVMTGTSGNETATLRVGSANLTGTGFAVDTVSTENVKVYGGGGQDEVTLYDSAGDDLLTSQGQHVTLVLASGEILETINFQKSRAYASSGNDSAEFLDTIGDDVVAAWSNRVYMTGTDYLNDARNFDQTVSRSIAGGNDRVAFYDTTGDDVFAAWSTRAYMIGDGYFNDTRGFGRTTALATSGGYDRAAFYDTTGNDVYVTWSDRAVLYGSGYYNDARGFERTTALATRGGYDQAVFFDSPGNDVYVAWSNQAVIYGPSSNYYHDARGFDRTTASATAGGYDQAVFFDSVGDDVYVAWSNQAYMYCNGYRNEARGFDRTKAQATSGGNDLAIFYDSAGDDRVVAAAWGAYVAGGVFHNEARDFDDITVHLTNGGNDETDIVAADYAFQLLGQSS